ncbi:MAG: FAD:protein FMN transferase [Candidatus Nanopelagicales bacterium]
MGAVVSVTRTGDVEHVVRLAGSGGWERRTHEEPVWGTVVTFDVRAERFPDDYDEILARATSYLHQVDGWFSTYRADTPITMLRNGLAPGFMMPREVTEVLEACRYAKRLTRGAFDPWAVRGGVDPSGYVKGWAAAQVADLLVRAGLTNVCVDCAGDIACRGEQAPGEPWAIGILNPYDTQQVVEVVRIGDGAIATSGLYERGRHIDNPRDGSTDVHYDQATIVGPDGGLADALATAALIEGPGCAAWFAGMPEWSVYLVKDGTASYFGPAFAHLA